MNRIQQRGTGLFIAAPYNNSDGAPSLHRTRGGAERGAAHYNEYVIHLR